MLQWIALTLLVVVGLLLRWDGLSHGYTSDEVSLALPWSTWEIIKQGESAVNPPWYPALFNALFEPHDVVRWARRWSLAMSGVTIFCIAWFGKSYGNGSLWAGTVAACLFVFDPWAIDHATVFRVYSTATAVAAWHLLALGEVLNGNKTRTWLGQLMLSAFVLPQLHYYWFVILGILALTLLIHRHRWAWLYLPAGLGMVPWLVFMWITPSQQNPSGIEGSWASIQMLATLGSHYGSYWAAPIGLTALLLYRWLSPMTRAAFWIATSLVLATAIIGQIQMVRPPVSLFLLISLCAILAGLLGRLPTKGDLQVVQPFIGIALIVGIMGVSRITQPLDTPEVTPHNNLLREWSSIQRHVDEYEVEMVIVQPEYYLPVLHLYQTSRTLSKALQPCDTQHKCYTWENVLWTGHRDALKETQTALIVSLQWTVSNWPERCSELRSKPAYSLWLCSPTTTSKSGQLPTTEQ